VNADVSLSSPDEPRARPAMNQKPAAPPSAEPPFPKCGGTAPPSVNQSKSETGRETGEPLCWHRPTSHEKIHDMITNSPSGWHRAHPGTRW
jgi:hypothetical protein